MDDRAPKLYNTVNMTAHQHRNSTSSSRTASAEDGVSKELPPLSAPSLSADPAHDFIEPASEKPVVSPEPDGDPSQPAVAPLYSAFTHWEKRLIVLGAALGAFFSPLTAQVYFPALNVVADAFRVGTSQINLTVTTYMVFQGVTPMFIGGLADVAGRRPAYVVCFVVYVAANIGVALCQSYAELLVLRCLQSAGSASTVALCQAVVADVVTSAERGQYIGITSIPMYVEYNNPGTCVELLLTISITAFLRHHSAPSSAASWPTRWAGGPSFGS